VTYIVQSDLEDRIGASVLVAIADDSESGVLFSTNTPLARIIKDAESYVEGFLAPIYSLTALRALGTGAPNEVLRLCLDVAEAFAIKRHPEYIRGDWKSKLEFARRDLVDIRTQKTQLDITTSPEPAANVGGVVRSGDPDDTTPATKTFLDGMGIFLSL